MGLPEVSKVSAATVQQNEQNTKSDLKLKKNQESKSELSQALSKGKTSKEGKTVKQMQIGFLTSQMPRKISRMRLEQWNYWVKPLVNSASM